MVDAGASYEYLLSMSLSSLTLEKVEALKSEAAEWQQTVARLRATTEKDMWRADLELFEMVSSTGWVGWLAGWLAGWVGFLRMCPVWCGVVC